MRLLLELAQKMVETMPWIGAISFDLGPAPVLKEIQCKDLPVCFAGRAFLCRGRDHSISTLLGVLDVIAITRGR